VLRLEDHLLQPAASLPPAGGPDDLAMIIHTSGSTGVPKGAMMSHANMTFAAGAIASYLENTAADVVLSALPITFTYGLYQVLAAVHAGATLVLQRGFAYPADVLEIGRREGATGLPLVPSMAAVLLAMKDRRPGALPNLRYITNAAAPLPPAHVEGLQALFPAARLYSMYGLTECARATYLPPDEIGRRPGSVGKAIPGTEVAIVDAAGRSVPCGGTGELVIHGPHVMQGYWRDEAATREALRPLPGRGGMWLHTGDLLRADEGGFLYFVGRRDDMLKVRGEKVAPRQVEAALHDCPGVAEAVVVGRPDPISGHVLHAVVVPSSPTLTERDVLRHCARSLPDVMVPRTVEFRAELPKTASGKVARRMVA
jgi:acyl-CoA synthetase (AMP-forming)/AMP-acid ligase II